jgi:hypothetical protein
MEFRYRIPLLPEQGAQVGKTRMSAGIPPERRLRSSHEAGGCTTSRIHSMVAISTSSGVVQGRFGLNPLVLEEPDRGLSERVVVAVSSRALDESVGAFEQRDQAALRRHRHLPPTESR